LFSGENDNDEKVEYSRISAYVGDASDGTEDGNLYLQRLVAGTQSSVLSFLNTETVVNDGSLDLDFRVESNGNANMLFVDGGNNRVGIGTNAPQVGTLHVHTATAGTVTASPQADDLVVENSSETGITILSPDDQTARIRFSSPSTNTDVGGALIFYRQNINKMRVGTTVAGGKLGLDSGASIEAMQLDGSGNVIIQNTGGTLQTATAGTSNFRAGVNAGNSIASGGNYNVVVGDEAGTATNTGDNNTFVGYQAGAANTTGGSSSFFGYQAGLVNDGLGQNNFFGYLSGGNTTTGFGNVAMGNLTLHANVDGDNNTAIGSNALRYLEPADGSSYNTAVGSQAGILLETGVNNTFVGGLAGDGNTAGSNNTAVGKSALSAGCGDNNTSIGANTLTVGTGTRNTAIGVNSGFTLTSGVSNTLLGGNAGNGGTTAKNLTTGDNNTLIGDQCTATAAAADGANALGFQVSGEAGFTTLGLAADDIRAAHGTATWATVSDQRYKKDIVDSTAGLSFINALQPRTFKYKNLGELPETFRAYEADSTDVFKNSDTNHGFIAQEVKTAIDADSGIKDGFKLWAERDDGSQEVGEAALIPILTKAVQELSTALDAALARIAVLEG